MKAGGVGVKLPVEQRSYRLVFWLLASLNLGTCGVVLYDEARGRRPWIAIQEEFNRIRLKQGLNPVPIQIRQLQDGGLGSVDRCPTCHLGITSPLVAKPITKLPRLFQPHPQSALYLGKNHPPERFGCTVCHGGQGAQTKGVDGRAFDHGRDDPYWEQPLLPKAQIQSRCASCHEDTVSLSAAPLYNRGRRLFRDRRCDGCHRTDSKSSTTPRAPSLASISLKTSASWVARWLKDSRRMRADSQMPLFWPEPAQSSRGSRAVPALPAPVNWRKRRDAEIAAVTAYLGAMSSDRSIAAHESPAEVDPALVDTGRGAFDSLGCRGCHTLVTSPSAGSTRPAASARPTTPVAGSSQTAATRPPAQEPIGPDLSGVGARASARWLDRWLQDPRSVWSKARMPNFRLSAAERAALVAFLVAERPAGAPAMVPHWPRADRQTIELGRKAIIAKGCYGCHEIPGVQHTRSPGPDLIAFGDKTTDQLSWGPAREHCAEQTLACWTGLKLDRPDLFADASFTPRMPTYELNAGDRLALTVYLLSGRKRAAPEVYRARPSHVARTVARGEEVLAHHGCSGCHELGRRKQRVLDDDGSLLEVRTIPIGGDVRRYYRVPSDAPPPLTLAGRKFRYDWLHNYLANPSPIRPWLQARMPTYHFAAGERSALIAYFAAASKSPYPFVDDPIPRLSARDRDEAHSIFAKLQCAKCHRTTAGSPLTAGEIAPSLGLSLARLRPQWVRAWLRQPQALQPGTKMPSYFPLQDDDDPSSIMTPIKDKLGGSVSRQIEALTALTFEVPIAPDTR
jgi:cytochrome c2